ncbi:MAG: hypothetical protein ACD_46C00549G0003 [uncultured bacterium]|nr:MAG: hypothetical protein ACD_46C00549G0003 [uncultured bacterium]
MKKLITIALITSLLTACNSSTNEKKIGIIVPLEHKAMNEIVAGFTETLQKQSTEKLIFKIENAQGDMNLQRAIISQMKNDNYALIVPIGTSTTQMTASMIHDKPIVSLATTMSEQERQQMKNCNIDVVHDEISSQQLIDFIHVIYPNISHITLIHSTSDKIFPEVKNAVNYAKKYNIEVTPKMISTLNDLPTTANSIQDNTQAILVLKDSLVVSGITTLEKIAEKQHIPLITSDQGSVQDGAGIALGVHEKQIGIDGATLASKVLTQKKSCVLPMVNMTNLTIFVNQSSLQKENQSLDTIQTLASKLHYPIEMVDANENKK